MKVMAINQKNEIKSLIKQIYKEKLDIDSKYFNEYNAKDMEISSEIESKIKEFISDVVEYQEQSYNVLEILNQELEDLKVFNKEETGKFMYRNSLNNINFLMNNIFNLIYVKDKENVV